MCRLAIYAESDPYDKENYNETITKNCIDHPEYIKYKKTKTP